MPIIGRCVQENRGEEIQELRSCVCPPAKPCCHQVWGDKDKAQANPYLEFGVEGSPSRAPQRGGLRTLDGHGQRNTLLCPRWQTGTLGIKTIVLRLQLDIKLAHQESKSLKFAVVREAWICCFNCV